MRVWDWPVPKIIIFRTRQLEGQSGAVARGRGVGAESLTVRETVLPLLQLLECWVYGCAPLHMLEAGPSKEGSFLLLAWKSVQLQPIRMRTRHTALGLSHERILK